MFRFAVFAMLLASVLGARAESFEIPFWPGYKGDGLIIVGVRLNGRGPYPFALDSCSATNVIDEEVLKDCGAAKLGTGEFSSGGKKTVEGRMYRIAVLQAGGASLTGTQSVMMVEHGSPFRGFLGVEFFQKYVVQVDFDRRMIIATPSSQFHPEPSAKALPFELKPGGIPRIGATVEGHPGTFLIDTGNLLGLELYAGFARKYRLDSGRKTVPATGIETITGVVTAKYARMRSLELGPFAVAGPVALVFGSASDGLNADGNIGIPELRRFRFTLDFSRQTLYLEQSSHFSAPIDAPRSGIIWKAGSAGFVVERVLPGSPAQEAGLESGDRLLQIERQPVVDFTADEVDAKFMEPAGTMIPLTIRRRDGLRRLVLTLRDLL